MSNPLGNKIFLLVFILSPIVSHAETEHKLGFEFGLSNYTIYDLGKWNVPDVYELSGQAASQYARYNDTKNTFGLKLGIIYRLSSLLSVMGSFGFGLIDMHPGDELIAEDSTNDLRVSYKVHLESVEPEIGVQVRVADISLLGSEKKDVSIGLEGRFGVEKLTCSEYSLVSNGSQTPIIEVTNDGWYANLSWGVNAYLRETVGASFGLTDSVIISAMPKNGKDPTIVYPYVSFYYFL